MSEIPVIAADSFEMFRDLLALVGNEKRAMRLLNTLEDRLAKVSAAESKLAADREAHAAKVARDLAELEDKATKLRAKELALMGREALAEQVLEREKAAFHARHRPLVEGGTITREPA